MTPGCVLHFSTVGCVLIVVERGYSRVGERVVACLCTSTTNRSVKTSLAACVDIFTLSHPRQWCKMFWETYTRWYLQPSYSPRCLLSPPMLLIRLLPSMLSHTRTLLSLVPASLLNQIFVRPWRLRSWLQVCRIIGVCKWSWSTHPPPHPPNAMVLCACSLYVFAEWSLAS